MVEEELVHEVMAALRMVRAKPDVLDHVEGPDVGEAETLLAVHADQFAVEPQGGRADGQAENGVGLGVNLFGRNPGGPDAQVVIARTYQDFHT